MSELSWLKKYLRFNKVQVVIVPEIVFSDSLVLKFRNRSDSSVIKWTTVCNHKNNKWRRRHECRCWMLSCNVMISLINKLPDCHQTVSMFLESLEIYHPIQWLKLTLNEPAINGPCGITFSELIDMKIAWETNKRTHFSSWYINCPQLNMAMKTILSIFVVQHSDFASLLSPKPSISSKARWS